MTVKEVVDILKECEQDRNVYIRDIDGTAQIVTVIGDLRHVNTDMPGVKIPDDVYFMTSAQFEEFGDDDEDECEQPI
jgi:hypothetical protein